MRISPRIVSIGALVIAAPLVFCACSAVSSSESEASTDVITVCDQRPWGRYGAMKIITAAGGDEYFIIPSEDVPDMWQGIVYEIDVKSSKETGDLIVGHKRLKGSAQPCP